MTQVNTHNQHTQQLIQSLYDQHQHRHVTSSVSTNSELLDAIKTGKLHSEQIHLLTAESQTAGRGQHGRHWQSPKGNVYLSLYYPVNHAVFPLTQPISGLLSLCVGHYLAKLAIIQRINKEKIQAQSCTHQTSTSLCEQSVIGVKWANDIGYYQTYSAQTIPIQTSLNQKPYKQTSICPTSHTTKASHNNLLNKTLLQNKTLFHKLSGILIEPLVIQGKMIGVVIGVGLNVQHAPTLTHSGQEGMNYQSVALQDLCDELSIKAKLNVSSFYTPISHAILQAIITQQMSAQHNELLTSFLTDFSQQDILSGREVIVTTDDQSIRGKAIGINRQGCLQLQLTNGKVCDLFSGKIDVVA